jgi:hypothetical protein
MVDLGPLFALGQALATSAIATSGTTVTLTLPEVTVINPDTLTLTTTPGLAVPHPAIVAPVASSRNEQPLPGVDVRAGDWRIVLPPSVPDPSPLVDVAVTACRDTAMIGRHATVLGCSRSSAGAVLTVFARPVHP